jgi:hypothetical protein
VRYGDALKADDPLVVFYKAGELVAQYRVRDLVARSQAPRRRGAVRLFVLKGFPQFMGVSTFRVVTVEGVECTFDYHTGKLLSKLRP